MVVTWSGEKSMTAGTMRADLCSGDPWYLDIVHREPSAVRVTLNEQPRLRVQAGHRHLARAPPRPARGCEAAQLRPPEVAHGAVIELAPHHEAAGRGRADGGRVPEADTQQLRRGLEHGRGQPGLGLEAPGLEVDVASGLQAEGVISEAAQLAAPPGQLPVLGL